MTHIHQPCSGSTQSLCPSQGTQLCLQNIFHTWQWSFKETEYLLACFAFVVCWANEIYFSKVPTAMTDKAQRKYPEWKWKTYHSDTFFPDCCLLQKETWNYNFCLWRNFFIYKINYIPISVSSLISFCLSGHKEIRTVGSAQYRGASVFSVGDRFHSLCLTLPDCGSAMEHEVDNFKENSMMCLRSKCRVPSSALFRYNLVIFSCMHINL